MTWILGASGGRGYTLTSADIVRLSHLAEEFGRPEFVMHGAAQGADLGVHRWALQCGYQPMAFEAPWRPYGVLHKGAGAKRNKKMEQTAVVCAKHVGVVRWVFFPGGAGTQNMYAGLNQHTDLIKAGRILLLDWRKDDAR